MFYLFMGFAAVWLLVTLYLIFLGFRQRRVEDEINSLQEEIAARRT
ncbi:MAG: CcmD family protein [Caldilineaceae bacterium]|nr:CcmD family protein [Caldilineaceae bacterium]